MNAEWNHEQKLQVQRLALRGYDFDASSHLVLEVEDAFHARRFLGSVLRERGLLTFGERERDGKGGSEDDRRPAVSVGFTYRGLQALGVPDRYLSELRLKAPAFCEGAPARAALRLGDAGPSAAERWEPMFAFDSAHVLISIHGPNKRAVDSMAEWLADAAGGRAGFKGWEGALPAEHLTKDKRNRAVHFGFRDNLARPRIVEERFDPHNLRHRAGELVLGYLNDEKFNRWDDGLAAPDVAQFFRNGSFAVLRKIEQNEEAFNNYLNERARALHVTEDYLKAKLCGRWPNGVRVMPGHLPGPQPSAPHPDDDFDFTDDMQGFGCPFGAHIRRTNPRKDSIAPPRLRPLFRRGMPYGPEYCDQTKHDKRGLIGLFFCASIEDQFETVMSEWVEKKPMGPRHLGNAKDPLVGHHDDETFFHIPQKKGPGIKLTGFKPFVTTRGTLYALLPSVSALREIARMESASLGAQPDGAKRQTGVPHLGDGTRLEQGTTEIEEYVAPNDRFCDIVMEGGVTSGIIYASAVAELAKSYRFSSIGGSSIGAFAAALTAAAEYSRRRGSMPASS